MLPGRAGPHQQHAAQRECRGRGPRPRLPHPPRAVRGALRERRRGQGGGSARGAAAGPALRAAAHRAGRGGGAEHPSLQDGDARRAGVRPGPGRGEPPCKGVPGRGRRAQDLHGPGPGARRGVRRPRAQRAHGGVIRRPARARARPGGRRGCRPLAGGAEGRVRVGRGGPRARGEGEGVHRRPQRRDGHGASAQEGRGGVCVGRRQPRGAVPPPEAPRADRGPRPERGPQAGRRRGAGEDTLDGGAGAADRHGHRREGPRPAAPGVLCGQLQARARDCDGPLDRRHGRHGHRVHPYPQPPQPRAGQGRHVRGRRVGRPVGRVHQQ
mmetsp:Transcript_16279/g.55439  ORF Transcript_16279/g.55439 Transcript_16279/m.55439 type:complete len:325 (-) Transcript_16279:296-1270(-)